MAEGLGQLADRTRVSQRPPTRDRRQFRAFTLRGVVTLADVTVLLGGTANPFGAVVQYVRAPAESIIDALSGRFTSRALDVDLLDALLCLLPFESPWSRLLLAGCGEWTALLNNGLYGGDSTAPGPALSRELGVECVVASNVPRYGPGHEQTQLEVFGAEGRGEPPLMHVRAISATATDGRWEWYEAGTPFEFEQLDRYAAKRKRDRFDRDLLIDYLVALGIPAADDSTYGPSTLLQEPDGLDRRIMTLEEARADFR